MNKQRMSLMEMGGASHRCKCGKWTAGMDSDLCWICRRKKDGDRIFPKLKVRGQANE